MNIEFESFWKEYPKKVGKGEARKAWGQMKQYMPSINEIIEKLKQLKRCEQWKSESGKYIPHPSTWLRREGWEDEVEVDLRVIEHCQVCGKEATKNTGNGWACSEHFYQVRDTRLKVVSG